MPLCRMVAMLNVARIESFKLCPILLHLVQATGLEILLKTTWTEVVSILIDEMFKGYLTLLASKAHDVENLSISQNTQWSVAASTYGCDGNTHHSGVWDGKIVGTSSALCVNNAKHLLSIPSSSTATFSVWAVLKKKSGQIILYVSF